MTVRAATRQAIDGGCIDIGRVGTDTLAFTRDTLLQLQLDIRCNTVTISTSHYSPLAAGARHEGGGSLNCSHDITIG